MTVLVSALTDLTKTFCSGLVSLFSVPAQTLHASFGSFVFVLPFLLIFTAIICKVISRKKNDKPKLFE